MKKTLLKWGFKLFIFSTMGNSTFLNKTEPTPHFLMYFDYFQLFMVIFYFIVQHIIHNQSRNLQIFLLNKKKKKVNIN